MGLPRSLLQTLCVPDTRKTRRVFFFLVSLTFIPRRHSPGPNSLAAVVPPAHLEATPCGRRLPDFLRIAPG